MFQLYAIDIQYMSELINQIIQILNFAWDICTASPGAGSYWSMRRKSQLKILPYKLIAVHRLTKREDLSDRRGNILEEVHSIFQSSYLAAAHPLLSAITSSRVCMPALSLPESFFSL